jgi:hypothetical protein
MPWVGSEPMIPASGRAKTVHALDHSVSVTGRFKLHEILLQDEETHEIYQIRAL